jgi:hypothetical protein
MDNTGCFPSLALAFMVALVLMLLVIRPRKSPGYAAFGVTVTT